MRDLTQDNFGLLIAYLLPGFVALWGAAYYVGAVHTWIHATPPDAPSVGGFLYSTLASTAAGVVLSAIRWATIDRILAWSGVRQPTWQFELLAERLAAYEFLVCQHYRYYQFYANMAVALACTYGLRLLHLPTWTSREAVTTVAFLVLEAVLLLGSWDTLRKYYARTSALLANRPCDASVEPCDIL
jgi:hypothetical protein